MPEVAISRKQRLRTLENQIREGMEEFYYVGMKLKEIRDDRLYKEDGFETWTDYCKERWEWSLRHATQVITASEYREKLPTGTTGSGEWSERSVRELTRIEDKKDAAKVASRVIKAVEEKGEKLTASTVRKFVDKELGVDRTAKAKETRRKREEEEAEAQRRHQAEEHPDLEDYLNDLTGRLEQDVKRLGEIDPDEWKQWKRQKSGLVKRLTAACAALIETLEDVK